MQFTQLFAMTKFSAYFRPMQRTSQMNYVIIVAGGTGTRMQSNLPKQFIELAGKPIIVHAIEKFVQWDPSIRIIVVMHADFISMWTEMAMIHCPSIKHQIVGGGAERFDSVKAGLAYVDATDAVVGIHDAARPLVSIATLQRCYEGALHHGSAIPCIPVTDSVRMLDLDGSHHLDRTMLRAVQTPQCFEMSVLSKAYEQPYKSVFTDDASVVEAAGFTVQLVDGNRENIKITNPEDILVAESLLGQR